MSRYNVSIIDAIPDMVASRFIGPPQPAAEILPRTDHEGASFYIGWMVRMITASLPERGVSGQSGAI
ncbi:hypothetical protein [Paenibacillus sp. CR_12]|uniref:hypothetical protein n=1 Tax=Paenibacillus sp. CR_12 TaxID=3055793 RepID=UPI0035BF246D